MAKSAEAGEHHLPDDVAFFVRTGAKCNSNGSISVVSIQHEHALFYTTSHRAMRIRYNRASACGGSSQRALRRHPVRERRLTAGVIALPATIDALPEALATYFHVRPYAINAINLKLRDLLLDLIAIGATTTTPS